MAEPRSTPPEASAAPREHPPRYATLAIANYLIDRCRERGIELDHLKLQKLVYFTHGWYYALTGRPLINERIEAWKYGPVVRSLYHRFKHYGRQRITEAAPIREEKSYVVVPTVFPDDEETRSIVDEVLDAYGHFSGVELSSMAHREDSPWHEVWHGEAQEGAFSGVDIPNQAIRSYFERRAEMAKAAAANAHGVG